MSRFTSAAIAWVGAFLSLQLTGTTNLSWWWLSVPVIVLIISMIIVYVSANYVAKEINTLNPNDEYIEYYLRVNDVNPIISETIRRGIRHKEWYNRDITVTDVIDILSEVIEEEGYED